MNNKSIQVKGTLPLIAEYFKTNEKRIYSIFNLNTKKETGVVNTEVKKKNRSSKERKKI